MSKSVKLPNDIFIDISSIKQDCILAYLGEEEYITLTGYEKIPLYSKYNLGNCFTISNGEIIVNKTGYYEISAQLHFQNVNTAGVKWLELRREDDTLISATPNYLNNRASVSAPITIAYLRANQHIKLKADAINGDRIRAASVYSWVYVKRISKNS